MLQFERNKDSNLFYPKEFSYKLFPSPEAPKLLYMRKLEAQGSIRCIGFKLYINNSLSKKQ